MSKIPYTFSPIPTKAILAEFIKELSRTDIKKASSSLLKKAGTFSFYTMLRDTFLKKEGQQLKGEKGQQLIEPQRRERTKLAFAILFFKSLFMFCGDIVKGLITPIAKSGLLYNQCNAITRTTSSSQYSVTLQNMQHFCEVLYV